MIDRATGGVMKRSAGLKKRPRADAPTKKLSVLEIKDSKVLTAPLSASVGTEHFLVTHWFVLDVLKFGHNALDVNMNLTCNSK